MRVLKWIVERCEGKAKAVQTAIGYIPEFSHLEWKGLESFDADKFKRVCSVDRTEWKRELQLQDELLQLIGKKLPPELAARRSALERALD